MHLTHIVIDDFFPDPDQVRQTALRMQYPPRDAKEYYPGRNGAGRIQFPGLERFISNVVKEPVVPAEHTSHCQPRIALAGDDGKVSIHIDPNHWSALIYLSKPEDCRGGTHFFRHKATGWDRAPVFPGEPEKLGYKTSKDALDGILNSGGANDRSQWEEIMTLPMRYNRLVIFRGYLYHDAGESFGDSLENGRLIIPLFFQNPQADKLFAN